MSSTKPLKYEHDYFLPGQLICTSNIRKVLTIPINIRTRLEVF
jgi:hypothetical protein